MSKAKQPIAAIPDKSFFSIGDAASLCGVKPHVLRYWEQEFSQLKPIKRRGNRRFYKREDVLLVRHIRELLYDRGFTITGARAELQQQTSVKTALSTENTENNLNVISELEKILDILN